jgi:PPOX class probable F420-dependent enzyme
VIADLPGWALELLRDARVARLGTADATGHPLVVPVCFAVDPDSGRIYSAIDTKPKRTRALRRLRNIAENPRACVLVDRWDEDWTRLAWVMVEGRAETVTGGPDLARALDLLVAKYPQYGAMGLAREATVAILVRPDRVRHWRAA